MEQNKIENVMLNYNMDLQTNSFDYLHTPAQWAMNLPFYVESLGHFFACDFYFTEREKLKSYLLIYTKSGHGKILYEGNEISVKANSIILIDCLKYQHYKTDSRECWEFIWMHLNGTAMDYYYKLINEEHAYPIDLTDEIAAPDIIEKIMNIAKNGSGNIDLKFSNLISSLLTEIILSKNKNTRNVRYFNHKSEMLQAVDTIKKNYKRKISIESLADRSHLSKYYFGRIFKEFTGQTPYEYLIYCRIGESKKLLLNSDKSISVVGVECGFEDASNFIRYFKKYTGLTPGAFRKAKVF